MARRYISLIFGALLLIVAACGQPSGAQPPLAAEATGAATASLPATATPIATVAATISAMGQPKSASHLRCRIRASQITLRSSPANSAPILGVLKANMVVRLLARDAAATWVKVSDEGALGQGWIPADTTAITCPDAIEKLLAVLRVETTAPTLSPTRQFNTPTPETEPAPEPTEPAPLPPTEAEPAPLPPTETSQPYPLPPTETPAPVPPTETSEPPTPTREEPKPPTETSEPYPLPLTELPPTETPEEPTELPPTETPEEPTELPPTEPPEPPTPTFPLPPTEPTVAPVVNAKTLP